MRLGYLLPEFPGQTHVWIWREIRLMRRWGCPLELFSTRQPPANEAARHDFAETAIRETTFLWPQSPVRLLGHLAWAALTRPIGLWRCVRLALTLPIKDRPRWRRLLPLVLVAAGLAREARRRGIDHFHCHSCSRVAILAMMVKRLTTIPYSLVLHSDLEWWGGAMREKLSEAEFTMVVAGWLLEQLRREHPELREEQAIRAAMGVDTTRWKPDETPRDRQDGIFRLITVGRLHAGKGHDLLLRAVHQLTEQGRRIHLTIVGAGPAEEALKQLAGELKLTEVVEFAGSHSEDQIIEMMRRHDAFALASHAEALGVVFMEAMALEVATIGTAVGGVPEIITSEENGLLVPPQDEHALAKAIDRLIDDPDLRRQLARNGRRTIVDRFDCRIGAAALYQRLHGSPPGDTIG